MMRIDIVYGGEHYSVGGRDIDELKREIDSALETGAPYWLTVNIGEGRLRTAFLSITPGVPIALYGVDDD